LFDQLACCGGKIGVQAVDFGAGELLLDLFDLVGG
jgi:hypothetical protein